MASKSKKSLATKEKARLADDVARAYEELYVNVFYELMDDLAKTERTQEQFGALRAPLKRLTESQLRRTAEFAAKEVMRAVNPAPWDVPAERWPEIQEQAIKAALAKIDAEPI